MVHYRRRCLSRSPGHVQAAVKISSPSGSNPTVVAAPALVVESGSQPEPPKVGDKNIAPTTTEAEDLVTHGQRKINLIWEITQAIIAVLVTAATLWVAANLALKDKPETAAFLLLSNAFFLVVTAYLVRTNHSKVGGVKPGDIGR